MTRLAKETVCWVATTRPDGRPHLTPIWYVWVEDSFWVCTYATAIKTRNLTANPNVAVSLQDGMSPLVAETVARVQPQPYPPVVVEAFQRTFDWDITAATGDDARYDTLVELQVQRWLMGDPDD